MNPLVRSLRKNRSRQRRQGTIVILTALLLVVTIAFLAFSIDFGYVIVTESELQNAADAGATSGAKALSNGRAAAVAATKAWVAKNVAANQSVAVTDADVEIGSWDSETASFTVLPNNSSETPNAVRVTCRRTADRGNALKLFFAPVLGTSQANLTVTSTARIKSSRCGLIIGLEKVTMSGSSHTDSFSSDSGPYSSATAKANGHVCSNDDINMSGSAAIVGNAHPGPGHKVKSSSSIGVTGNTVPLEQKLTFPPADPGSAVSINENASIPTSDLGKTPLNSKSEFTLSGGDGVDLPPGTYYFNKMTLSGGSSIRITGQTKIFITGDCVLSGGSVANLTFLPKHLQIYPMGSKCVISGDSAFYGVVYGPTAKVERSGDSDFYGSIVARELVLSGSGGIHADESLDSQFSGGLRRAILVQ
jgi:Flp pilus assembly protein TadG